MKVRLTKDFALIKHHARTVNIAILAALVSLAMAKHAQDAGEKIPSTSFLNDAVG